MPKDDISFQDLEKQVATDVLEQALKSLHDEITREIARNKKVFSEEISKTLASFRQKLEEKVTEEIDQKISFLFTKHFSDTSSQVKSSFDQMFSPVLTRTEEDMKRLQTQGENTLNSWKNMMLQYTGFWTRPFFLMLLVSVLTGTTVSLLFSYYMTREAQAGRKVCYSTLQWYTEKYFERKKAEETAAKQKANNQAKSKKKSK
jgi:predicted PurR-regulated permease PerM